MGLDQATLGRKLREARENSRLTQEAAAEAVGLSRSSLVNIEAGTRSLSTLELSDFARLYRRSVIDFFSDESLGSGDEDVWIAIPRLTKELVGDEAFEREVRRCVEICREGLSLRRFLAGDTLSLRPFMSLPCREGRSRRTSRASGWQMKSEDALDWVMPQLATWQISLIPKASGHQV